MDAVGRWITASKPSIGSQGSGMIQLRAHGDVQRAITAFTATPPELVIALSLPAGIGVGITGERALIEDADRFITRAGHQAGPYHDCDERLGKRPAEWHSAAAMGITVLSS